MVSSPHPTENKSGFELLFDRHPLPMWVFDEATFRFLAVNAAAVSKYGYSQEEFLGMTLDQIRSPDEMARLRAYRDKVRAAHGPVSSSGRGGPWRHRCKDGAYIDVDSVWSVIPFRGSNAMLVVLNDRTAEKRAEERSREHARLLDLASDAIVVCELDGDISFWNQGATHLYGWSADEALGSALARLIICEPELMQAAEAAVREQGEWQGEMTHRTKGGGDLIVNSRWTLVRDEFGEPRSVLVINTDITETKKLEAQFLRAQRLESIGTLASGIAHDLNNILSPILMATTVLRRFVKEPDAERMLGIIESSAERGASIVKQVLTFARGIDGERVVLQPKHLVNEISKIVAQAFPRNVELQTQYAPDLWLVTGDATQLHQVLLNLCVNARDAMPGGGVVALTAENFEVDQHVARINPGAQIGPHVVFRVSDTGSGIPPEIMDKIFDPFFTTKEVGKGTGLGLATVLGIVKSHRGFLTVQSEPGAGTSFRVFIPAEREGEMAPASHVPISALRGNGELILVVDDEASMREAVVQMLLDSGYRAYTAEDGSDALALYVQRKEEIRLVLTDLAMAHMDGIALTRALRKFDPGLPIIVSSGHCLPEQTIMLERLRVKHFLEKPYNAVRLLSTLRAALTRVEV